MVGLAIDAVEERNGDSVLDVEVPSNRPDCLSHLGIAREVSVIESGVLHEPTGKPANSSGRIESLTSVNIEDTDLCPRYAARIVRGVKIEPSPDWLVKRLEEIGQRPINNVADITNYVLHELGQPLHAFDLAKLREHRIVVRRARKGEKLTTLDGVERTLDSEMLVIADASHPVALAGIMGGEESEISNATADVLIESAYFDPDSVRRTARRLGMDTEASRRFERGADRENVLRAQTRCVELITEIAGGTATEDALDVYPRPGESKRINFRPARVESLTSINVELDQMVRILTQLGFVREPSSATGTRSFLVPSWRVDVSREEDLVEEVARHSGYHKIGSELPPSRMAGEYQPTEGKVRALRRALSGSGFYEAINFSFIEAGTEDHFALIPTLSSSANRSDHPFVTLRNPIIEEAGEMRPSLLPGLLNSVRHNFNQGIKDVRLFEIGRVFVNSPMEELPIEREALALVATGGALEEARAQAAREVDFYDLKGALESAVDAMKLLPVQFSADRVAHLRPGQAATVTLTDKTLIGSMGRLSETVASRFKFRQPVYVCELDLSSLMASEERRVHYKPLPRYPSVKRDVTLWLDQGIPLSALREAIDGLHLTDYRTTELVGTYEGSNIPEGKRAVTLRIEYRADQRTLRDEEVEELQRALIDLLTKKFGAEQH